MNAAVASNPLRRVTHSMAGLIGGMIGVAIFTWLVVTWWILPALAGVTHQGELPYRITQDVRTRLAGVPVRPQAVRPWGKILLVLVILVVAAAIVIINWPQISDWFWSVKWIYLHFGQINVDHFCGEKIWPCG